MKPVKTLLRLSVCLALASLEGLAYDFAGLKPEGYVSDFARVLDAGSREKLERYAKRLEEATGAQLAVVTLPGLAGEPLEEVANDLFRKWGIGQKGRNEGLLVLLVPGERRFRLEVGYGLEPIIPDGYAGSVLRSMRPALREGRYGEALLEAAHELGARIAQAKGAKLEQPARRRRSGWSGSPIPILAFVGGILLFAVLSGASSYRRARRYYGGWLPALLMSGMVGRAWGGSHGGGGFGSYDSGDSFGGFGGGDSGGGGASSSW